jgi:hypothetical protein
MPRQFERGRDHGRGNRCHPGAPFCWLRGKKSKKEHHEVTKNTKVHEEERCEMGKAADKGGPFLSKKKGFSSWLFLRALRVFVVIF